MVAVRLRTTACRSGSGNAGLVDGEIGMEPRIVGFCLKSSLTRRKILRLANPMADLGTADDWNMDVPIVTVEFRNAAENHHAYRS